MISQSKIIAFVYDFPHYKSSQGLLHLKLAGFNDVICLAAPWRKLNIIPSCRISPHHMEYTHPEDVAKSLGFEYIRIHHDDLNILDYLKQPDIGIILGARILRKEVVKALPIINLHPGLLPVNRGLDNIKWAIYNNIPQGVTAHLIDGSVDRGFMINEKIIDVFRTDHLMDIYLRSINTQLNMIQKSILSVQAGRFESKRLDRGNYNPIMNRAQDLRVLSKYIDYISNYSDIIKNYYKSDVALEIVR